MTDPDRSHVSDPWSAEDDDAAAARRAPAPGVSREPEPKLREEPLASSDPGADTAGPTDRDPAVASADRVVGVGPWQGEWPTGEHWDAELLREGDRRNVADRYRYWRMDAIIADLDSRRHAFHVAVENWEHDFNIGSVVRTANAFLAREVHIIGRRRWNRRGAMVTDRYQHVRHHASVEEFMAWARGEGLAVLAIDNVPGSQLIETFDLPEQCVLVFGQEGPGVSEDLVAQADAVLAIEQFGSTRSINAGAAAAVTMHAWIRRHVFGQRVTVG